MRLDTHCHSKHSKRPSEWILQKLGCPESFTEPLNLYRIATGKGMTHVTITDHNTIDGCLEIANLPHTFISEEATTYFPEDGCKLHVLVYNITEKQHRDIQQARENVYDLVPYLEEERIPHALAHPLYSVNGRLTLEHVEKALLLFKVLELNGARLEEQNRCLEAIVAGLTRHGIETLASKHNIEPRGNQPWKKTLIGGSDDHSSLTVASRYTEISGCSAPSDLSLIMEEDTTRVIGPESTPQTLAHNLYSIAYQFYSHKFNLGAHASNDVVFNLIDRFLSGAEGRQLHLFARISFLWNHRKLNRAAPGGRPSMIDLLRNETHRLIWDDPELSALFKHGSDTGVGLDEKWFNFVNRISNKVLCHFADHIINSLQGAHFLNLFDSLGSAGALYCVLAPYFVAFSIFSEDRRFSHKALNHFSGLPEHYPSGPEEVKVAHFTDTFYEINGVAWTLKKQIQAAGKTHRKYTVITCDETAPANGKGIRNFKPVRMYELSVYPEQKLFYPPFLEMLDYCYRHRFTHIHSATPGPLGLAALAIARILRLPIVGTYHTALPQYAQYLTEDNSVADVMWKYILWYYNQMNLVYVPSWSTAAELVEKGLDASKVRIFPRGVDTDLFHPCKANGSIPTMDADARGNGAGATADASPRRHRLLYVGRVSKEKNLELLVNVFKRLSSSRTDVELVVVGDGPYLEEMRRELTDTPTIFTGYRDGEALASIYASCDLFVFPSTTDTFGNVVLEAQASGLPVIVTDVGGPRENLLTDETGLVVKGDDPWSLLNGIATMLDDPNAIERMGKAARNYAETRSFDRAFDQAWSLYMETDGDTSGEFQVPWNLFQEKFGLSSAHVDRH